MRIRCVASLIEEPIKADQSSNRDGIVLEVIKLPEAMKLQTENIFDGELSVNLLTNPLEPSGTLSNLSLSFSSSDWRRRQSGKVTWSTSDVCFILTSVFQYYNQARKLGSFVTQLLYQRVFP